MATNLNLVENYTSPLRTIGAKVEFTDGSNTKTLKENDSLKSIKIEKNSDPTKFFGYGVSQKLTTVAIDKDKEINLDDTYSGNVGFKVGDGDYIDASPDFHITDVSRDEVSGELTITAYDALERAKGYTFADLGLTAPYSIRDVAEAIGNKIGARGVDSNHFSPNLVKPIGSAGWYYYNGGKYQDGYITLTEKGNSNAYYYVDWKGRSDVLYLQFTTDNNGTEDAYDISAMLTLYDANGTSLENCSIAKSNITGEYVFKWDSIQHSSISLAKNLKKADRIRIIIRNYTSPYVPYKFKDVIVSTTDVPYTPYGSDCAIRNLAKPIEEWALYQGATRSDGWINLPTTPAYSHYYVPWNGSTDTFYIKATVNGDAETFPYYLGYQFVSATGSILYSTVATYGTTSGETTISWNSSKLAAANKEKLKETAKIRVFFTGRAIDGVAVPYRFKDVRFSLTDGEYVPYEGAPFTTVYEDTNINYEGTETLQEVLNDIAGATQTIYYINNNGTLFFKKLDIDADPILDIEKKMYFSLENKDAKRIGKVVSATELGDDIGEPETADNGATQYVRDNAFWDLREDRGTLVQQAYYAVKGLNINQFTCSWRGFPFLEIGDKISFKTKEDNTIISYFLNDTLEYNGAMKQKTDWSYTDNKNETPSNPATLGAMLNQTYAKVDKANQRIELVAKESDDKYAQLVITTEGISSDVKEVEEQVETTKSELTEAINGVNGELTTVKSTVSTYGTQIEQNKTDINLRATKEELTTVKTTLEGADAANKELIDANAISVQTIEKSVSELSVNAEGISASVESLTKTIETNAEGVANEIAEINKKVDMNVSAEDVSIAIQTEMAKGTDRVITSTGYKFDEEGLTVSKTDSEMETKITENGMVVYKNGDAVLTANNQGVDAKNLHATTYLIVGTNSRFEDYGNRTGCFWVGGA
jgi:hypothetical protein